MTAEQFWQSKEWRKLELATPTQTEDQYWLKFAEAFAKQCVEQAERQIEEFQKALDRSTSPCGHLACYAETKDGGKHIICLICKVADLERERDTARETSKELNRRNGALQHTLNTLTDRNVWYGYYKAAMSLFGWEEEKRKTAESELREMREALAHTLLCMNRSCKYCRDLLARKAGS